MIKRALFVLVVIAAFVTVSGQASADELPRSYVMKCRGGGSMTIDFQNEGGASPPLAIFINFRKANNPRNLGPGECTWLDRGIRGNEPSKLWFARFRGGQPQSIFRGRSIKRIVWGTSNQRITRIETNIVPINRILDAANQGREFFVHVFNSANWRPYRNSNAFIVTNIGT